MPSPIEAPAENTFHDQMVCPGGSADSDSYVDLPLWLGIQIGNDEDLLFLIMQRIECAETSSMDHTPHLAKSGSLLEGEGMSLPTLTFP